MHLVIESGDKLQQLSTALSWFLVMGAGYGFLRLIRDCWRELRNREIPKMRYTREEWEAIEQRDHQKPPAPPA